MSSATSKLHDILQKAFTGEKLDNETFSVWLDEYFSKDKNKIQDLFQIKDKDPNDKDYSKFHYTFQIFKVKYGHVDVMNMVFINDLYKLLINLLPLIPNDTFLKRCIDTLDYIKNSIYLYKSGMSVSSPLEVPSKIPNYEILKMCLDLISMHSNNIGILDIFDKLIQNVKYWDLSTTVSFVTKDLYKICSNKNEIWLRIHFGPLKQPKEALYLQHVYSEHCSEMLFNISHSNYSHYSDADVNFLIQKTIEFICNMFEQIDVNLLPYRQKFLYSYVKDFFQPIFDEPEMEWPACFYNKFKDFLAEGLENKHK